MSPPPAPELSQQHAARRRALAHKIVSRHKNYAAMGGLVPLPVVNIAGVTAINLRMVKQLSELYQVPFERDRTRSLIVGLIGGAVPTGVGAATSSTLMWIVPGGMLLALGATALTAGALTRGIGLVFIDSFESGARQTARRLEPDTSAIHRSSPRRQRPVRDRSFTKLDSRFRGNERLVFVTYGFRAVKPIMADMPPCEVPSWISRSSSTNVTSRKSPNAFSSIARV